MRPMSRKQHACVHGPPRLRHTGCSSGIVPPISQRFQNSPPQQIKALFGTCAAFLIIIVVIRLQQATSIVDLIAAGPMIAAIPA
mmetsp:Transcript_19247/g.41596  ORF Transcript_19247/g.41596 Transcript_19247/m.41596 type:complete len:84 (+) Transcript_19247:1625-1876(+)